MKPKSIDSLMKNMRDKKGIQIKGSLQKKKLRYMGYYHGYKGYRYCNSPSSLFPYTDFNELQAVYDFDMKIKAVLYPQIMFLETALKNYALEIIVDEANSDRFADIYSTLLNNHKAYAVGTDDYKRAIAKRMSVRNKIYGDISRDYGNSNIVTHYYDKDRPVPIWAIFEIISLGEFGYFISSLNANTRARISSSIGVKSSFDMDARLVEKIVFTLKDLRNAVAHNNTVFDTRFKTGKVSYRISKYIASEIGISNITFNSIVDYVVLISFVMKLLQCTKTDITNFIKQFDEACEALRKAVPTTIYAKIIYTDTKNKLNALKNFL